MNYQRLKWPAFKKNFFQKVLLFSLLGLLSACESAYKSTGNLMVGYSKTHAVKYTLALDDAQLGCSLGEAFTPFLLSFERTGVNVDEVAILMNTLSAYCAEKLSWNAELRHLRALYTSASSEAKDALIEQKRYLHLASVRQQNGYFRMEMLYGEPGEKCPTFKNDDREFYYLIGLVNGLQAVKNSIASGQQSNVSLNIANKVGRGAGCLDSEKWWGLPGALQATVWSLNPSLKPEKADIKDMLRASSRFGVEQGVRLSHVFEIEVLNTLSQHDEIREVIKEHALAVRETPSDARLKLIDTIATEHVQAYSDRFWTNEKGYRTPIGQLGTFWKAQKTGQSESMIDIDDLI